MMHSTISVFDESCCQPRNVPLLLVPSAAVTAEQRTPSDNTLTYTKSACEPKRRRDRVTRARCIILGGGTQSKAFGSLRATRQIFLSSTMPSSMFGIGRGVYIWRTPPASTYCICSTSPTLLA